MTSNIQFKKNLTIYLDYNQQQIFDRQKKSLKNTISAVESILEEQP